MNLLILADMDDFHWRHGGGRADLLLACGDLADQLIRPVLLGVFKEKLRGWECPAARRSA